MRSTAVAITLLILAAPAAARVFTVTKTADTLDGFCEPYDCSLREAVVAANQATGTDVVELPPGTYVLTRTGAGEDAGATGDLDVDDPLILVGRGLDAGATVLDGNGADRVLDVRAAAEIFNVTVRNGLVSGPGGGALARRAALPYDFVVRRSVISGNRALGSGGDGGGVMSETSGVLAVIESTVADNRADVKGGGLAADRQMRVLDSTISGNSAGRFGGGLSYPLEWYASVSGSTITLNRAGERGGGLYAAPLESPILLDVQIQGSILAANTAPFQPDCSGAISGGYNVIGVGEDCILTSSDRRGTSAAPLDPKLETLSDLGGPTPVHGLEPGSPAFDFVPAEACLPYDQLGVPRREPCSAGALERSFRDICLPGGSIACLQNGRFKVSALWYTSNTGGPNGIAHPVPLTGDTTDFWFFSPENLELAVKVIDGCDLNDRFWVFASGLTDRGVQLTVQDMLTGQIWTYVNPPGTIYETRLDTSALDVCHPPEAPADPGAPGELDIPPVSAVFVVTEGSDSVGRCDHDCSLREAVAASNARQGLEVILLGQRTHTLTRAGRDEDGNLTGDLDATGPLVILGSGARQTVIDGGGLDRILESKVFYEQLEIHGVTLRNGDARISRFGDHGDGGAVHAQLLTLVASHVTGNRAEGSGGGFYATLPTLRDSTVSNNQAASSGGGGIATVYLDLLNATVSGNRAGQHGGGLFVTDGQIDRLTATGNSAGMRGGGLWVSGQEDCPSDGFPCAAGGSIGGSIVAGNQAPRNRDCVGLEPLYGGYNVFGVDEESGCAAKATDRAGTPASPLDPRLSPLGDHGGPTPTHTLLADSPAIDLGPPSGCVPLDQRGRMRPAGPYCDAGAVERLPTCQPDATTLCLGAGDRFRVTARWAARGDEGDGFSIPLAADTGSFWFFSPANVELTVKILDACSSYDRFWVFASGLTNVRVDIKVEDTLSGQTWTYRNPAGTPFRPRLDANAFHTCSEGS
ncbi:MAG TPA: CSLREA domain-containing protein [Thermoanaerobaculia bacterium]|jgi:CSLREA domain-containing protein|nr:CSLREA domain-containing protein [Thermoanaerobaculia bacterium]